MGYGFSSRFAFVCGTALSIAASPAPNAWSAIPLPFVLDSGEAARKHLPATMPGGLAVFDYDGDGRLDLFFANGAELPSQRKPRPNRLLRNLGNFRFQDVTAAAGLVTSQGYDFGAALGDYDGDGKVDLLVTGLSRVTLYRNQGNGKFADVTAKAGLGEMKGWTIAAAFFDLDNDGDLDLFLGRYVIWDPATERECIVSGKPDFCHPQHYAAQPSLILRNDGGRFVESGITLPKGKAMGVAVADFNQDGFLDLFVTNDREFAHLFENQAGRGMKEVAFERNVAVPFDGKTVSAMGADAADYDRDGRIDLIYTALKDETFPLLKNGSGGFEEQAAFGALTREMSGWGVAFADLDNDGWLDVAVARGGVLSGRKEPPAWFRNERGKGFTLGSGWEGMTARMHRGLVAADLNDDGCMDVVMTALDAPAMVLRNPCPAGAKADAKAAVDAARASTSFSYGSAYAPLRKRP